MQYSSRRLIVDVCDGLLRSSSIARRHQSTTSSIRAGLRSEQGTRGRTGRSGAFSSRDRERPTAGGRFSERTSSPGRFGDRSSAAGRFGERSSTGGRFSERPAERGRFREQSSSHGRSYERSAAPDRNRERQPSSDRYSSDSARPSRFRASDPGGDRPSAFAQRSSRQDSFDRQSRDDRFERKPRGPRTPTEEEIFEDAELVPGQIVSRKERRAQFWEDNKPEEDEDDVEQPAKDVRSRSRRQDYDGDASRPFRDVRSRGRRQDDEDDVPSPIPYTTASSQFIYGANAVHAALQSQTRKIYKLWLHRRTGADNVAEIRRAAQAQGVQLIRTQDDDLLNRLSDGRPHNGVVLETSPLPARPVLGLEAWNSSTGTFKLDIARQNAEEKEANGVEDTMQTQIPRRPLIVFLDGITDEGNVGNIIRTAHFYGADAVAIASGTCAPINSAVVAKASAGACEAIPIFDIRFPGGFIFNSRKNGWKIYAAVAPNDNESDHMRGRRQHANTFDMAHDLAVTERPSILMLGAEGEGLRDNLKSKSDVFVTIPGVTSAFRSKPGSDPGVDSLNVASAAAVLINAFKSAQAFRTKLAADRKKRNKNSDATAAQTDGSSAVFADTMADAMEQESEMSERLELDEAANTAVGNTDGVVTSTESSPATQAVESTLEPSVDAAQADLPMESSEQAQEQATEQATEHATKQDSSKA